MGPVLKLAVVAFVLAGAAACGNATPAADGPSKATSNTPTAEASASSSPATPGQDALTTNFSGQVDLVAKTRKVDKDGNCHGVGPNADLKRGATVSIRDTSGRVVARAALKPGTIIPLGDDGPQACRLPFSTPTINAVGRDFTAQVGDRKPVRFDVDDGMDVQIKVK